MIFLTLASEQIVELADGALGVELTFTDANVLKVPVSDAAGMVIGGTYQLGSVQAGTVTVSVAPLDPSEPPAEPPAAPDLPIEPANTLAGPQPPFRPGS